MTKTISERNAKDYVGKKEHIDGVLNWKLRAKGEADFKNMHKVVKKDEGELEGVDFKDKPLKNAASVKQPKEGMKDAKKTLKQFINQGGHGKSSARNADKTNNKDPLKKTSDGVTKVYEAEDELEERFAGNTPAMDKNSRSFTHGIMNLSDGNSIKVTELDAKILNTLVKMLNDSNRKKLFNTFSKNEKSAKDVLKFAKVTLGEE